MTTKYEDDTQLSPVEIRRLLVGGDRTARDVIRWAELHLVQDTPLGRMDSILELASLTDADDWARIVPELLTRAIVDTGGFAVTVQELDAARTAAKRLVRAGRRESIRRANCVEFVLGRCPQLANAIERQRESFGPCEMGLYNELAVLTDYIVASLDKADVDLTSCIQCIEWLLVLGDAEVREAAAIGVLEGIGNRCSHADSDVDASFADRLPPASRRAWDELDAFWMKR